MARTLMEEQLKVRVPLALKAAIEVEADRRFVGISDIVRDVLMRHFGVEGRGRLPDGPVVSTASDVAVE